MTNQKTLLKKTTNLFLLLFCIFISSCNGQNKSQIDTNNFTDTINPVDENSTFVTGDTVSEIGSDIRSILHDSNDNFWFGSDDGGVYKYDGKNIIWFNEKHGLCNNQVRTIQEDQSGNIWFGTGYGISRFDGKNFTSFTVDDSLEPTGNSDKNWKSDPNDLWFEASDKNGVYRLSGSSLTNLTLNKTNPVNPVVASVHPIPNHMNAYSVYTIFKDKKGNVWFGTQNMGVCCFDGKDFTWFTEKDLSGPAVRAIFEDKNGNMWLGNNGGGLFFYDGKTLSNFTEENGLSNKQFLKTRNVKDEPGTLGRVWTINEDNAGDLWIGTIDAGVWRYDGNKLTNYTVQNGLPSNVIYTIYKDRNGELWFGTSGQGVYKFDGETFAKFDL